MSAKPTIIFRLEMAQPLYVIALVACAASSRAAKYRHRVDEQLYLIIACFHWEPGLSCLSFIRGKQFSSNGGARVVYCVTLTEQSIALT